MAQTEALTQSADSVVQPTIIEAHPVQVGATTAPHKGPQDAMRRDHHTDCNGTHVEKPCCVIVRAAAGEFPSSDLCFADPRGVVAG